MAPPPGTLRVGRYSLALFALLAVLYGIAFLPGQRHTPKLGIDLVGGIRVIFTAQSPKGAPPPSGDQMTQARQILEDRINGTGVTGSTVVVQGSDQLVVEIPNGTGADVAKLGKAAVLNFRGLVAPGQPVTCVLSGTKAYKRAAPPVVVASPPATPTPTGTPSAPSSGASSPSGTASTPTSPASTPATKAPTKPASSSAASPNDARHRALTKPTTSPKPPPESTPKSTPKTSPKPTPTPTSSSPSTSTSAQPKAHRCSADPIQALFTADPSMKKAMPNAEMCPSPAIKDSSQCRPYTALSDTQRQELNTALQNYNCPSAQIELDEAQKPSYYIACETNSGLGVPVAYLLGTVVVRGQDIDAANAQAPNISNGGSPGWTVALDLTGSGGDKWFAWTKKYNTTDQSIGPTTCSDTGTVPCSDFVGFTLDGAVVSIPRTEAALSQHTSISGSFTQTTAGDLARELNYGKLPLSFRADANEHVSATLGASQLRAAFLAGGIGLVLVVLYSLLYYRGLGLITIASLLVSAGLTYAMLVVLGNQIGFTLDLAGIAGFIVALGITADSFVVFFERIKDEVHGGRSVRVAVPRAWVRARRTILSADTVSFLAAAILYFFASADVKGFAFTLGMSTILDLVVVFLFTHPIVSLLSRSKTFGSPRFTGLNSLRLATELPDEPAPAPRAKRAAGKPTAAAPTAVLDKQTTAEEQPDEAAEPAEPAEPSPPDERPRRRTTPAPGSAAERAAARRAKQRRDADEKGES